jgi:hypothetical protein
MFRIVVLEASLEFLMHWMVSQGLLMSEHRSEGIQWLRTWVFRMECALYVLGWLVSLFDGGRSDETTRAVGVTTTNGVETEELVRRMEEILFKQQQETREREERLMCFLQQQQATASHQQPVIVETPPLPAGAQPHHHPQDSPGDILALPPMYTSHQPTYPSQMDSAYESLTRNHLTNDDESFSESIGVSGEDSYNTPDEGWNLHVPDSDLDGGLGLVIPVEPFLAAPPPPVVTPTEQNTRKRSHEDEEEDSTEDEDDEDMESEPECEEPAYKKIKAT